MLIFCRYHRRDRRGIHCHAKGMYRTPSPWPPLSSRAEHDHRRHRRGSHARTAKPDEGRGLRHARAPGRSRHRSGSCPTRKPGTAASASSSSTVTIASPPGSSPYRRGNREPKRMGEGDTVIAYGGASPGDTHLMARVVAVDEEIISWLKRHKRRQRQAGREETDPAKP